MEAMDLGFDSAAARAWKANVDSELEQVYATLSEVGTLCTDLPSNDTIMQSIEKAGNIMQDSWNKLNSVFTDVSDKTGEIISAIESGVEDISELFNHMFS